MTLRMNVGLFRRLAGLLLFGLVSGIGTGTAAAQSVSGDGFSVQVKTGALVTTSGSASLSAGGGFGAADQDSIAIGVSVSGGCATTMTTGAIGAQVAAAETTSSMQDVIILNGVIRAKFVNAVSSSTANGASASSNAFGTVLTDLAINGVAVASGDFTPAPNTRIDLAGVGFVVLNEQTSSGDDIRTSGRTVNAIHVFLIDAVTGAQTGEIIVGSASSGANF